MKIFKTLLSLSFILILLSSCSNTEQTSNKDLTIEVGYINPSEQSLFLDITLSGRVKAKQIAQIRPQISGIIKEQLFTEGSFVKQNDVLYKIDDSTYKATYNKVKAELQSSNAVLKSALAKNSRANELLKFEGISKQEFEEIEASYLQALAEVKKKEAELEDAKINLDRCELKAPISGYIGVSSVTTGALVSANQSDFLASIKDSSTVFVDLNLSYNEYLKAKSIIDFENSTKVKLFLSDELSYDIEGYLQSKELSVDENTQTVKLRAVFENPNNILLSGMFVKAKLQSQKRFDGFLIPQQAILRDQKANPIITIINEDLTTSEKKVEILRSFENFWIIKDKLNTDDKVIIEGLNKINSKSKISPKDLNHKYEVKK
ncbi:efflux RND transporter periplasmic adaptor subunit [Arcobacter porcinus]|uniref:RND family efflux system, membrane fusion protein n=1 Tax=Arcobacter porcinus TaxID=1935204 RepID=A0A5C2HFM4_9BACT|nr:efflux RND transporter periplasmic adaptor subunit [Arcobacter porcinus]OCL84829.1 Antibiotic efflux pump periplasmic linker protein ArpA precursor [Arcobacter porcinus]OCL97395.1 Antibiotic efflux pump periplasmic linker protein ArpA precursor [Aliarcobacter thereius]QEP41597.1 RND family efflux system, membrane fusion protein [Arcobacter porcinus]